MFGAKNKLFGLLLLINFSCHAATPSHFRALLNLTYQACQNCYHYFCPPTNYPEKYSINLMWINQELDLAQHLIFPAKIASNLKQTTVQTILDWAVKNPTSRVNIWFDSQFTTKQAIKNTQNLLDQAIVKYPKIAGIKLKDVRKLKIVQQHPEFFTGQIPLYFRVDLMRVIAIAQTLNKKHDLYFVYSDLDIKPLKTAQIFDGPSIKLLNQHHFVIAQANNTVGFENGFKIFKYDKNLINGLQVKIIEPCLLSAAKFLKEPDMASNHEKRAYFQETVFRAYPDLFNYLAKTNNQPNLKIPTKKIKMPTSTSKAFELSAKK